MRATTIVDWTRKELIVPNKEFVTGQIVNWSLTDSVLRVLIVVGIAYGSNTRRAQELLVQVARANPNVVDDPEPTALFLGFGDSALTFELRAFVGKVDDFINTRNELHFAIDDAFRANGIEIAFPQRDVHVRTITSAFEKLSPPKPQPSDGSPSPAPAEE